MPGKKKIIILITLNLKPSQHKEARARYRGGGPQFPPDHALTAWFAEESEIRRHHKNFALSIEISA